MHGREDGWIEIALIERGFAAADYGGDDAGIRFDTAHGADGLFVLGRDRTDFEC